ncbi:MAG: response regulator [Planctomycetes bacterium]|nr:response regulator [Planctomycetota bacterium]
MLLRTRVLAIVIAAFAVVACVVLAVNAALALHRFRELERIEVLDHVDRLRARVADDLADLSAKASDWSNWDDAWLFCNGSNPEFPVRQITPTALSGNRLGQMIFLDRGGSLLLRSVAPGEATAARSPAVIDLVARTAALRPLEGSAVAVGIEQLPDGLVMIAARPVLHSDSGGPASGTMVWIRDIDSAAINATSASLGHPIGLWPRASAPAGLAAAADADPILMLPDDRVAGLAVISDRAGDPSIIGQVVVPRRIWIAGRNTLLWQAATTAAALILTAFGAWLLLDRLVGRRVAALARQTDEADRTGEPIRMPGDDEISRLASAIEDLRVRLGHARDEAISGTQAKSVFLATMSHEIRTPLNGVLGMAQLLQRTRLDAEQREYVDIVQSSGDALLTLLNDILDFSKIEAGRIELEQVSYRLPIVIGDAMALMSARAQEKGIALVFDADPDLPDNVIGDPGRLRQIITNLVGNAVKFTDRGHVRIGAGIMPGPVLQVEVEDTGMGMDADACSRLFQPFVQANAGISRTHGGTGLGLAICGRLAALMGGGITVSSTPGSGSRFTMRLPVLLDPGSLPPRRPELPEGARILIACHPAPQADWLARMARHWDARPEVLPDADALAAALAGARPELVIIDRDFLPDAADQAVAAVTAAWPGMAIVAIGPMAHGEAPAGGILIRRPIRRERLVQACDEALRGEASGVKPGVVEAQRAFAGRVLLVDDHPVNRRLGCVLLAQLGVSVVEAADGAQALERLNGDFFDLVLMDCLMPGMDGYAATAELRRREAACSGRRTPVVALTANASSEDRQRCQAAGMDDFLPKPLREEDLVALLARHLPVAAAPEDRDQPVPLPAPCSQAVDPQFDLQTRAMLEGMPGSAPGMSLFHELLRHFRGEFPHRFDELAQALIDGDAAVVRQRAHAMRGSCMSIGLAAIGEVLGRIEAAARKGDVASGVQCISELESAWRTLQDRLAEEGWAAP